jgi:NDP-sugar pyrophosphorylase family protein
MKALILAAGYGTRLLPHTEKIPKPLFSITGRPIIDIIIRKLIDEGCTGIIVNTHHRHADITDFINRRKYPITVLTRFEKNLLGTGGAIKNVCDFLGNQPFLVINSDILTDIDIHDVYKFHIDHQHPVTLVMHDYPEFNTVWIDAHEFVIGFDRFSKNSPSAHACLAFTGIQIVDPVVMDFIPEDNFITSIEVYQRMISAGYKIKTYISKNHYWRDLGSPESFTEAVFEKTSSLAILKAFGTKPAHLITRTLLAGDGSDRKWYRITSGDKSLVMADHGIKSDEKIAEINSFILIGQHLHQKGIPVPKIHHYETFAGLVYLQDLGDTSLQMIINNQTDPNKIIRLYEAVIDQLLHMAVNGAESFDTSWTYQTKEYDRQLILEKECRYFVDAFLNGFLNMNTAYDIFEKEFLSLSDLSLKYAVTGFMHRDLQSRNIMVKDNRIYFIDFQGGRLGPLQYDLASLLNDPYVNLPETVKTDLIQYCLKKLQSMIELNTQTFIFGYQFCTITRLLQTLGAFGYLSQVKQKKYFESYIPAALSTLKKQLCASETNMFKQLTKMVSAASMRITIKL